MVRQKLSPCAERIEWIFENLFRRSQANLSRETGVPQSTLSKILSGDRNAGKRVLDRIAAHPLVNVTWLMSGKGDPLEHPTFTATRSTFAAPVAVEPFIGTMGPNAQKLKSYYHPVPPNIFSPSAYFLPVGADNPVVRSSSFKIAAGDYLLLEPDKQRWPAFLVDTVALVTQRNCGVRRFGIARFAKNAAREQCWFDENISRLDDQSDETNMRHVDISKMSAPRSTIKGAIKIVATVVYRCGINC